MVKVDEAKPMPVTELVLVMNWFQDLQYYLRRLAPAASATKLPVAIPGICRRPKVSFPSCAGRVG